MKFTKEEARKELASKFSPKVKDLGKWERTIEENVETLWNIFGENSEIELSEFTEKALPLLETTAGFLRKETSDIAKIYEDKIKNIQNSNENGGDNVSRTEQDNDLIRRLEALEQENERNRLEMKRGEIKRTLIGKMKENGVSDDGWIETLLTGINIGENFDIDANADNYVKLYNKMKADVNPSPTPDKTGGDKPDYTNNTIAEAAKIAKLNNLAG